VNVNEVRKDAGYAGARVLLTGQIARAKCKTQIDIGFGDAVTPAPVFATYPAFVSCLLIAHELTESRAKQSISHYLSRSGYFRLYWH